MKGRSRMRNGLVLGLLTGNRVNVVARSVVMLRYHCLYEDLVNFFGCIMSYHCVVANCSNGGYRLMKWKREICGVHGVFNGTSGCSCDPPFTLWPFPTRKSKPELRDKWKTLINRAVKPQSSKLISPSKDMRVCSRHFKDGRPSEENPLPTEELGYPDYKRKVRRVLRMQNTDLPDSSRSGGQSKQPPHPVVENLEVQQETVVEAPVPDPTFEEITSADCVQSPPSINGLLMVIFTLLSVVCVLYKQLCRAVVEIHTLLALVQQLRQEIHRLDATIRASQIEQPVKREQKIKVQKPRMCPNLFRNFLTEKNVKYYTGLKKKALVKVIHDCVVKFVRRRWQGIVGTNTGRNFSKIPAKFGPKRNLKSTDELLLVLMRLRLGLDLRDLADRFGVSVSLASKIWTSWLKALTAVLRHMIFVPCVETLLATKPLRYKKPSLSNLAAIVDCTEFFLETPQDLPTQCATWSSYKHHNTLKALVAVCPNSFICYISPAYEGRITDTEVTKDCGFLEMLPPYSAVMADKGFNLSTECANLGINLIVPPGRRGQSQMPTAAVEKTKKVANLRILVEQVIRRLKSFKFLKNELTLSAAGLIDETLIVCAALCNLMPPVYSE